MAKVQFTASEIEFETGKLKGAFSAKELKEAMRVATKRVLVEAMARIRKGFQVGGYNPVSGAGGYWKKRIVPAMALKKKLRAKTREGKVTRIRVGGLTLVNTGMYRDSITRSEPKVTRDGAEGTIGTNVPYVKFHEQPGNAKGFIEYKATSKQAAFLRKLGFTVFKGSKITLPQRRVFVMPEPWQRDLSRIFGRELRTALKDV